MRACGEEHTHPLLSRRSSTIVLPQPTSAIGKVSWAMTPYGARLFQLFVGSRGTIDRHGHDPSPFERWPLPLLLGEIGGKFPCAEPFIAQEAKHRTASSVIMCDYALVPNALDAPV